MDPLDTLLEDAEQQRNLSLAAFNHSRARCDAARAQAGQLEDYRAAYRQRWSQQFTQGSTLDIVRCYQAFADRLEAAIAQQAQALAQAMALQSRANDELSAHELRVASVRKLIERRAGAERQRSERREQKTRDEQAARAFALRGREALRADGLRS